MRQAYASTCIVQEVVQYTDNQLKKYNKRPKTKLDHDGTGIVQAVVQYTDHQLKKYNKKV